MLLLGLILAVIVIKALMRSQHAETMDALHAGDPLYNAAKRSVEQERARIALMWLGGPTKRQ